jgi:hypothetical protein
MLHAMVDAALTASRALVGISARSLAAIESDVTLPQYRALVVLAERGEQTVSSLAEALDEAWKLGWSTENGGSPRGCRGARG